MKSMTLLVITLISALILSPVSGQHTFSNDAIARNHLYAPWDPGQIDNLRNSIGLVGPGPQNEIPEATFPDYLKKPETIEQLLPQAMAAVIQKGGRSPLGLAEPGDVVLIVVPYDSDKLIQQAIIRAFASRRIEARIIYENDLLSIPIETLDAIKVAKNIFKAGDGQQESGEWFEMLGNWPDFNVFKSWVRQEDPVYYDATWPEFQFPDKSLADLDRNFDDMAFIAIIEYLDQHPEVNRVYYKTASRTLAKNALKHHGNIYMGKLYLPQPLRSDGTGTKYSCGCLAYAGREINRPTKLHRSL